MCVYIISVTYTYADVYICTCDKQTQRHTYAHKDGGSWATMCS